PLCSAPFDLIWGSHPLAHDQPSFGGVAPSTIRLHPRSDKKSAQLQKLRLPHRGVAHKNYRHAHRDRLKRVQRLNTHSYLEETLQRDIGLIETKILEMSGLSERALEASLQALIRANRQLAYSVILRDQYIDELETELDRLCLEFLVRQQPVAGHL